MKYAVVEMEWSVGMRGKRLRYSVSEIAAISLDEDLHTIDTFRFLNREKCLFRAKGRMGKISGMV